MRIRTPGIFVVLVVLAAACTTNLGSIEGRWVLDSGTHPDGDIPTDIGTRPTLVLEGERINGRSHCNTFSGRYRVNSSGRFEIVDGLAVTEMACADSDAMDAEMRYLQSLQSATSFSVGEGTLTLEGAGHRLVFSSDTSDPTASSPPSGDPDQTVTNQWFPTETYGDWELERGTLDGGAIPIADSHPVKLSVSEQGFGGQVCNSYGFVLGDGDEGSFPEIFSTMMLCTPDRVMESEQKYLDALRRFESARVESGKLVIEGDGVQLIFRPAGG